MEFVDVLDLDFLLILQLIYLSILLPNSLLASPLQRRQRGLLVQLHLLVQLLQGLHLPFKLLRTLLHRQLFCFNAFLQLFYLHHMVLILLLE